MGEPVAYAVMEITKEGKQVMSGTYRRAGIYKRKHDAIRRAKKNAHLYGNKCSKFCVYPLFMESLPVFTVGEEEKYG